MCTFVPDHTCWSLLLTALEIRLRNKPTYDKLRVLIINKDEHESLARKNGNENPIWSWNNSVAESMIQPLWLTKLELGMITYSFGSIDLAMSCYSKIRGYLLAGTSATSKRRI